MDFKEEENRIYIEDSNCNVIAEVEFEEVKDGVYNIFHTFVDEKLRGQGIASKLVEKAVETIKRKNGKVEATCSYAKKWLEKNKD